MRKLVIGIVVTLAVGAWPALAQNTGGSAGGTAAGSGASAAKTTTSAPANPTVPPALTPDSRVVGSAPVGHRQPTGGAAAAANDPYSESAEDKALDRKIKSICRGC